jgi:hypothetical protein
MPSVGFESPFPVSERPPTHALDRRSLGSTYDSDVVCNYIINVHQTVFATMSSPDPMTSQHST